MSDNKINDKFKFIVWDNIFKEFMKFIPSLYHTGLLSGITEEQYKHRYVLKPCIGLKDKNDNLVYEGFILKKDEIIVTVFFDINSASYQLDNKEWDSSESIDADTLKTYEIIGNIYENPEILGEK